LIVDLILKGFEFTVRLSLSKPDGGKFLKLEMYSSHFDKRLCRNIIIELSLNPSLEKRGTFTPFSSIREGGEGVELLNFPNCDTVSKLSVTEEELSHFDRLSVTK
jgi:hypothetical protein